MSSPFAAELPPDALAALRAAYDREVMTALLGKVLPRLFPPAAPFVDSIVGTFYEAGAGLPVLDRERVLIALLAAKSADFTLAMHFYLGLMEGLAVEEIAQVLLLVGAYDGIDCFTDGLFNLRRTLRLLAAAVADGHPLDPHRVYLRISHAFRGDPDAAALAAALGAPAGSAASSAATPAQTEGSAASPASSSSARASS